MLIIPLIAKETTDNEPLFDNKNHEITGKETTGSGFYKELIKWNRRLKKHPMGSSRIWLTTFTNTTTHQRYKIKTKLNNIFFNCQC
jgi:hypothetical protein